MKKLLSLLLCFAMLCSICVLPSSAYTAGGNADKETMAVALKELGLFKGVSENDFALNRELTRVEALVMLIRVMGKESDALSDRVGNPFTDTPDWAERYMGYAYKNQLTYGVSDTKYGDGSATAATFLTFILRALGYSDANGEDFTWDDPFTLARRVGILDDTVNLERFTRGDAVTVAYYALFAHIKNSSQTLADRLISDNAFTKEKFESIVAAVDAAGKDSDSIVGLSAYDIAVKNGFKGTEKEWLASLVGAKGSRGAAGADGKDGKDGLTPYIGENNNWWIGTTDTGISAIGAKGDKGDTGAQGEKGDKGDTGATGADGKSAYELAQDNGFIGTLTEWLDSLVGAQGGKGDKGDTGAQGEKGDKGDKGDTGAQGEKGDKGDKGDTGAQGEKGDKGDTGATGADGKSAYELAQDNGFIGTLTEWLASLVGTQGEKGDKGDTGAQGEKGDKGDKGDTGVQGDKGDKGDIGATGANGKSAYELAQDNGFIGSLTEWLASLIGAKGDKGDTGAQGEKGDKGDTGATGADGKSAYELAQDNGFIGTLTEWLASLVGAKGDKGDTGAQGEKGDKGDTGAQGEKGDKGDTGATGADGKSAYELAQDNGFAGSLTEWLASLVGAKGDKGDTGAQGEKGDKGDTGAQGEKGDKGDTGATGADGKSAYELAQDNGFVGTLTEWLASLVGAKGDKGDTGAQGEKGDKGDKGDAGAQGEKGDKGDKGDTGATGADGKSAYELAQDNGFIGSLTEWLASLVGAKGDKGDTGAQGEKGDKGDTGADGRGIERTELVDGELIVHYTDGTSDNLGPITVSAVASSLECLMFTRRSDGTLSVSLKSGYESSVLTEKIIIPSQYNGIDVTCVGSFEDARSLKEIILPNTITEISSEAFYNCSSLESITLSEGLLKIGEKAFFTCFKLKSITIPASVNYISAYAFYQGGATEFQEIIFLNPDGWVAGSAGAIPSSVMTDKWKIAELLSGGEMYNGNLYDNKILTRENP